MKLETGLQAIVRDGTEGLEQALDYVYGSALVQQRCIFHKLRNVSNKSVVLDRAGKKLFLPFSEEVPCRCATSKRMKMGYTSGDQERAEVG